MPIYEFFCKKCKGIFESFVIRKEDSLSVQCPRCGDKDVQKMASSFCCGGSDTSLSTGSHSRCGSGGTKRRFG